MSNEKLTPGAHNNTTIATRFQIAETYLVDLVNDLSKRKGLGSMHNFIDEIVDNDLIACVFSNEEIKAIKATAEDLLSNYQTASATSAETSVEALVGDYFSLTRIAVPEHQRNFYTLSLTDYLIDANNIVVAEEDDVSFVSREEIKNSDFFTELAENLPERREECVDSSEQVRFDEGFDAAPAEAGSAADDNTSPAISPLSQTITYVSPHEVLEAERAARIERRKNRQGDTPVSNEWGWFSRAAAAVTVVGAIFGGCFYKHILPESAPAPASQASISDVYDVGDDRVERYAPYEVVAKQDEAAGYDEGHEIVVDAFGDEIFVGRPAYRARPVASDLRAEIDASISEDATQLTGNPAVDTAVNAANFLEAHAMLASLDTDGGDYQIATFPSVDDLVAGSGGTAHYRFADLICGTGAVNRLGEPRCVPPDRDVVPDNADDVLSQLITEALGAGYTRAPTASGVSDVNQRRGTCTYGLEHNARGEPVCTINVPPERYSQEPNPTPVEQPAPTATPRVGVRVASAGNAAAAYVPPAPASELLARANASIALDSVVEDDAEWDTDLSISGRRVIDHAEATRTCYGTAGTTYRTECHPAYTAGSR